jgi:hypothetical protein
LNNGIDDSNGVPDTVPEQAEHRNAAGQSHPVKRLRADDEGDDESNVVVKVRTCDDDVRTVHDQATNVEITWIKRCL